MSHHICWTSLHRNNPFLVSYYLWNPVLFRTQCPQKDMQHMYIYKLHGCHCLCGPTISYQQPWCKCDDVHGCDGPHCDILCALQRMRRWWPHGMCEKLCFLLTLCNPVCANINLIIIGLDNLFQSHSICNYILNKPLSFNACHLNDTCIQWRSGIYLV